ncbi:MAG: hypothetical protein L0241_02510, partial [Planctomycetia bacterium]|nr:hypothetical protein [Planctomycetia bacterium]
KVDEADQVGLANDILTLLQTISEAERELGGGGLMLADQRAEPGAIILTLRHTVAEGASERAVKLAQMLRRFVDELKVEPADVSELLRTAVQSPAVRVNLLLAGSRTLSWCEVLPVAA